MKISLDTVIRTILLLFALTNQILTASGHPILPFNDEFITELVTILFTLVASILAWWKNNSFTKNAVKADDYLNRLKSKQQ